METKTRGTPERRLFNTPPLLPLKQGGELARNGTRGNRRWLQAHVFHVPGPGWSDSAQSSTWDQTSDCPAVGKASGMGTTLRQFSNTPFRLGLFPAAASCLSRAGPPLVKFRKSAGICRNLNGFLCFCDGHGLSEIGFVRRIFADFARPTLRTRDQGDGRMQIDRETDWQCVLQSLGPGYFSIRRSPLMGKNGTGWDVFEGFQARLAILGNAMRRGSAAYRVIIISR